MLITETWLSNNTQQLLVMARRHPLRKVWRVHFYWWHRLTHHARALLWTDWLIHLLTDWLTDWLRLLRDVFMQRNWLIACSDVTCERFIECDYGLGGSWLWPECYVTIRSWLTNSSDLLWVTPCFGLTVAWPNKKNNVPMTWPGCSDVFLRVRFHTHWYELKERVT